MKSSSIVIVLLIALTLLIVFCILVSVPAIEKDLNERSKRALTTEGIEIDTIYFNGQEAVLKGATGSQDEKDQIAKIVAKVPGVDGVSNHLIVQEPVAVIIRASGESTIENLISGKYSSAKRGTHLIHEDKIITGKSGRMEIRFLDKSSFLRIRPNSTCIIKAKKEKNTVAKNIFVEVGTIYARVTLQKSLFEVATTNCVAAVKGTSFWTMQELTGATSFLGEEGVVEVRNDAGLILMRAGDRCRVASKDSKLVVEKIDLTKSFYKIVGDNKIIFDQSGSSLSQEHSNLLNKIKDFLDEYPTAIIEIQGYTDAIGNYNNNLILSEQRAEAVKEYLVSKGVDPANISAKGYGEKDPIASNRTEDGRRRNRRVEFKVKENK